MNSSIDATKEARVRAEEAKKKKVTQITVPMLNQMLAYCDDAEEKGWYYGPEAHFRQRHRRIVAWLEAVRDNKLRKVAR